jgi:hypothetical protein
MHTIAVSWTRLKAATLGAVILIFSAGAALSVPAGAATPTLPQTGAAQSAAAWLGAQFNTGGFIPLSGSTAPDLPSTVNSVLALAGAGVDASTANNAVQFLEANSASYISANGSDGPGQLSLLILDAHALGVDPATFGGTDLVARLLATEQTTGPNAGRFGTDAQVPNFNASPFDQGLALAALKAAGVTADTAAISWLQGVQCPSGGWTAPDNVSNPCGGDPTLGNGPDTNTTAVAIEGLVAQGALTSTVQTSALTFLETTQDSDDAGWGFEPNPSQSPANSDPNSTSLVIQALLSMGLSPTSATFTRNGATPVTALLHFVVPSGPDAGAIASPFGSPTAGNLLATYQTVPALAGLTFPFNTPPAPIVTGLSVTSGPVTGGTSVVITGQNLSNPLSVTFGTVAAPSFTVDSGTSITAISPTAVGTGPVDVTVKSFGGTSATSTPDQFTYEPTSGPYSPLTPARICDTRAGNPSMLDAAPADQCNGSTVPSGGIKTISVAGDFGVPVDALAVMLNVTVVNPTGPGFVTAYPAGVTVPATSNINYTAGQVVPDLVEVGTGTNGDVSFYSSNQADLVVDIEGYTAPTAAGGLGAGLYTALPSPARICDTRAGVQNAAPNGQCSGVANAGATLSAGGTINVSVTGASAIPAGATGAVLNVTAVNAKAPGFLTVYPEDSTRPLAASNVNYVAGQAVANRVVVPLSTTGGSLGQITVYSTQSVDVVVDVSGFFSASGGSGSQFNAEAAPLRICDTRSQSPSNVCTGKSIGQGGPLTLNVAGLVGVPANATAVVVNLTGVTPPEATFLTVFPGPRQPSTSDLNLSTGDVRANLVVAKLSSNGTISIANSAGTTNVVVDVLGWYAAPPG